MIELKPCSFCGSGDIRINKAKTQNTTIFWAECENCNARTNVFNTREEAATDWNRKVERPIQIHKLKIKEKYFKEIITGKKTFEYRKDDRGYKVRDILHLCEINEKGNYTGQSIAVEITYIFRGEEEIPLPDNYIIMGIDTCNNFY